MFDIIKEKLRQWIKPLFAALIIVCAGYIIWLFTSYPGRLTLDRITGNFTPPEHPHTIKVYSGNECIYSTTGPYSIQKVDDYYVIMNHESKNKSVKVYGQVVIEEEEKE